MEKSKRAISARTLILLFAAVVLCALGLAGAVNVTQAQLTAYSEEHRADIEQTHLGVALTEKTGTNKLQEVNVGEAAGGNGQSASLLADETALLAGDPQMIPGKMYDERISVRNASNMDEYVRVNIYKYWTDEQAAKVDLDPTLIELAINDAGWVKSEDESTDERLVYYLPEVLAAGADGPELVTQVGLKADVAKDDFKTAVKTLGLDEVQINLEARVDSIQTHNAAQAAKSAWGVDIATLGIVEEDATETIPWTVTFDGTNMVSQGSRGEDGSITDAISGLQPGDEATFEITLINDCDQDVDWWVRNQVVETMEGKKATLDGGMNDGGYYRYELTYEGEPLFTNDTVGGDASAPAPQTVNVQAAPTVSESGQSTDSAAQSGGLFNATQQSGMEDYFHLGTFGPGEQKTMTLSMAIDGETHTNNYFDTDAGALIQYAAEPVGTETIVYEQEPNRYEHQLSGTPLPQTGDLIPLLTILCFLLGCIVLAAGGASYMNDVKRSARSLEGASHENDQ